MAQAIVHFEIHVGDIERAKKFYGDVFGWTFTDANMGMEYWLITTGRADGPNGEPQGINGALTKRSGAVSGEGVSPNAFVCTIQIDDIDATLEQAKAAGAVETTERMDIPNVGQYCGLKDPDGNFLAVLQPSMNS